LTAKHAEDLELVRRMVAGDGEVIDRFAERYPRALYLALRLLPQRDPDALPGRFAAGRAVSGER
jgi:hypothetical protein